MLEQLHRLDLTSETMNVPLFAGLGMLSAHDAPGMSSNSIAARLWPGSASARPLSAEQLLTLSVAPPSISKASTRARPANLAIPSYYPPESIPGDGGQLTPSSIMSSRSNSSGSSSGRSLSPAKAAATPERKGEASPPEYGEEMFSVRRKAVPAAFQ